MKQRNLRLSLTNGGERISGIWLDKASAFSTSSSSRPRLSFAIRTADDALPKIIIDRKPDQVVVVEAKFKVPPTVRIVWNDLLAFSAFFDMMASCIDQIYTGRRGSGARIPLILSSLTENRIHFSLAFSFLWFLDSFITARENWVRAKRELDRNSLLLRKDAPKSLVPFPKFLDTPTLVYCQSILLQLILLPVGFYYYLYFISSKHLRGERRHVFKRFHYQELNLVLKEYEDYYNYSLLYAIIHLGMSYIVHFLREEGRRKAKVLAFVLASHALRQPISFGRRVRKLLKLVRWLKYLIPIMGTSMKFWDNFKDMRKKMRQKREARIARKIRKLSMRHCTPEQLREHAVLKLQKVFRGIRVRRLLKVLRIIQGHQETIAAVRLQRQFRHWLARAREQLRLEHLELAKLQEKQRSCFGPLCTEDRTRMYHLQQELQRHTDFALTKILLRHNSRFVVWWKAILVIAVGFEIGGLVLQPYMVKHHKSYNNMLEHHIVPERWSNLPVCRPKPPKPFSQKVWHRVTRFFTPMRRLAPIPHSIKKPWYCSVRATRVQEAFRSVMLSVIRNFHIFLAVVFFWDVFITFFTGELDENSGCLKPPGFFTRYIFPGILFQCIVNPQMETTAKIIQWIIRMTIILGPSRITRWTVAIAVPIYLKISDNVSRALVAWTYDQRRVMNLVHQSHVFQHARHIPVKEDFSEKKNPKSRR